ncbi:FAD-dependent oxidoreductase [uncultured Marinobacter sp.]|uniref:NAD(P)/FAD-dependent oxidoreductase n=1 Tax=uncultured Marinobacter sp. TaxID=187379 RepID=UPI00260B7AD9|nr:FAD-dependent oxidoreductase [uncultured Marinobacter sp.]
MTNNLNGQQVDIRRVAVVGSGLAGLSAAILLKQQSYSVAVFEKSRGPGGRLAAKRVAGGSVDIGAQYFTIRNPEFRAFLEKNAGNECFGPWNGRLGFQQPDGGWQPFPEEARHVGIPRMTAISRALASNIDLQAEVRIDTMARKDNEWFLTDTSSQCHGPFDQVIVTAPPAQARDLLANSQLADLAATLDAPVSAIQPCWALAVHFETAAEMKFEGMRPHSGVLSWIANNSSKPGRQAPGQWWVLHATSQWSAEQVETPADEVTDAMLDAFREVTGCTAKPDETVAHRWLYARSEGGTHPDCLWFPAEGIGLAGDWLSGGRVEGAFDSARALVTTMTR